MVITNEQKIENLEKIIKEIYINELIAEMKTRLQIVGLINAEIRQLKTIKKKPE